MSSSEIVIGNSEIRLNATNGTALVEKSFDRSLNGSTRQQREIVFYEFYRHLQGNVIPQLISHDPRTYVNIMSRIPGRRILAFGKDDILQCANFIATLNATTNVYKTRAADAYLDQRKFSIASSQVTKSLLAELIGMGIPRDFEPVMFLESYVENRIKERQLHSYYKITSPSDFGLHNCLKTQDGKLMFYDFEHAGRCSLIKLVADFWLHPQNVFGSGVTLDWIAEQFLEQIFPDCLASTFEQVVRSRLDHFMLRWLCITGRRAVRQGSALHKDKQVPFVADNLHLAYLMLSEKLEV